MLTMCASYDALLDADDEVVLLAEAALRIGMSTAPSTSTMSGDSKSSSDKLRISMRA